MTKLKKIKMKKIYLVIIAFIMVIAVIIGIKSCRKHSQPESTAVEKIIKNNESYMLEIVDSLNNKAAIDSTGIKYSLVWFETCVELTGEVDTLQTFGIVNVLNVYQILKEDSVKGGTDTDVYLISNDTSGIINIDIHKHTFWVGDMNMQGFTPALSFNKAFNILKTSTYKLPNSRFITLRQELNAKPGNPQYIFGNDKRGLLFVDAVTGDIVQTNPLYIHNITPSVSDDSICITSVKDSTIAFSTDK
jgi:hypothetical protein